ncbi:MAG: hypothetical protein HY757_01970 [Nitrospirae bacterium]|nr:hypothetical protein [Nitrospirota bacterium]
MKRVIVMSMILFVLMAMGLGSAWSSSLPKAHFVGSAGTTVSIDPDTSQSVVTLSVNGTVSLIEYLNNTTATTNTPGVETILGKQVSFNAVAGNCSASPYAIHFADTNITVRDGTFTYFSANLAVTLLWDGATWVLDPPVLDTTNPSQVFNLSGISTNIQTGNESRYITDVRTALGSQDFAGMLMGITPPPGVNICDNTSGLNVQGIIDGTPPVVNAPAGTRTIGYWKNHVEQRDRFSIIAVRPSIDVLNVYLGDTSLLINFLGTLGKKSMLEKAKQQYSALLLNIAATLSPATVLHTGELQILRLLDPAAGPTSTVGDANIAISNVIINLDADSMEDAKDLADEINNRDHNGN